MQFHIADLDRIRSFLISENTNHDFCIISILTGCECQLTGSGRGVCYRLLTIFFVVIFNDQIDGAAF